MYWTQMFCMQGPERVKVVKQKVKVNLKDVFALPVLPATWHRFWTLFSKTIFHLIFFLVSYNIYRHMYLWFMFPFTLVTSSILIWYIVNFIIEMHSWLIISCCQLPNVSTNQTFSFIGNCHHLHAFLSSFCVLQFSY